MRRVGGQQWALGAAGLVWLLSLLLLLYVPKQSDFWLILAFYAPAFAAYLYLLNKGEHLPLRAGIALAVLARLAAVPAWPLLSDDIYRFIWDGQLLVQGYNPFAQLPAYYLALPEPPHGISEALYEQLNSLGYFTIYPPVAQGVFALGAWLFPKSWYGHAVLIKLFLLACELGVVALLPALLRYLGLSVQRALIYLLNPLVIVEVMGNLHFEGAMVCFLLLAFWWGAKGNWKASATAMALSVASKLLPLMFLPFLIRRLGWKRSIAYFALIALALLLLFAPLLGEGFFAGFGSSLDLYFRRFEFNASIYYIARWVGYQWTGYNEIATIGPILALCTFTGICVAALLDMAKYKDAWANGLEKGLPIALSLLAITLYLFFTPTVHPWYVILPLFLCSFTEYRYPVLWSGLIVLTYVNYSYEPYWENPWVVAAEYSAVGGYLLYEWQKTKKGMLW
jgi:hypothetical protein